MESRKALHSDRERNFDLWDAVNIAFYMVSFLAIGANAAILLYLVTVA